MKENSSVWERIEGVVGQEGEEAWREYANGDKLIATGGDRGNWIVFSFTNLSFLSAQILITSRAAEILDYFWSKKCWSI